MSNMLVLVKPRAGTSEAEVEVPDAAHALVSF